MRFWPLILSILYIFLFSVRADFEFLKSTSKSIHKHQYIKKYGELELPSFFFPINRPSEAASDLLPHDNDLDSPVQEPVLPQKSAMSNIPSLLTAVYLFSSVCFILCLRGLSTPETAKRGNILGMVGMAAAIIVTFSEIGFNTHYLAFALMTIPAAILGLYIAQYVSMVQMPQLVAIFHSFVGLAAMLVGFSNFLSPSLAEGNEQLAHYIEIYIGVFIAAITFIGSITAACKLHEILDSSPLRIVGRHMINGLMGAAIIILGFVFSYSSKFLIQSIALYSSTTLSLILGFHLVASIGGADMPVVISMLNSYSGFATAASGFMLDNSLLIISGSLIGSSGAILSYIMCRGMNRDIINVILGGWEDSIEVYGEVEGFARETSAECVAEELVNSKNVLIVPGYGMAVSRCQAEISEIAKILISRGIRVEFGIHPVAGRMPGHMNVLLAEADVPYNIVKEMDHVNPHMSNFDTVLVIGANDTVNPAALEDNSKISGMPVIEAWKAKKVFVLKRSMAKGYAAIENPLFFMENTRMLFGDAKTSTSDIFARISQKAGMMQVVDHSFGLETPIHEEIDQKIEYPKSKMKIGIIKESSLGTDMVSITPKFVSKLRLMGFKVYVEAGAGEKSNFSDQMYLNEGAIIKDKIKDVLNKSDIILKIGVPSSEFVSEIPSNKILISNIWPARNKELLKQFESKKITVLALDEVPRVTKAQKLDVRSSMSNLQGYRAVIEAFGALPRLSKASISAAGTIEAAKVFVIGAGVAGLQAISTAHGLGAQVLANDTRRATREEVESLGAKFVEILVSEEGEEVGGYSKEMGEKYNEAQRQLYNEIIKNCDVVICTAAIPGKASPKLVTKEMVRLMKPGSVIVDLATEFGDTAKGWGGNCEISVADKDIIYEGVKILGRSKIEYRMPKQASELFSMNMVNLLEELGGGLNFTVDGKDEITTGLVVVNKGVIIWSLPQPTKHQQINEKSSASSTKSVKPKQITIFEQILQSDAFFATTLLVTAAIVAIIGGVLDTLELQHLFLFVLALIVGYYCVWSVTPALHTPLMSVTNALSGVIIIASMVEYDGLLNHPYAYCALFATFLSSLNIFGGFYVTKRMLDMFKI